MGKRLTLVTIGTRGDVQPYLALGQGLQAAGYQVTIATQARFAPLVRQAELDFWPVFGDVMALMARTYRALDTGRGGLGHFLRHFRQGAAEMARQAGRDILAVMQRSDGVVFGTFVGLAHFAAAPLGIPDVVASLLPITPSRFYPSVGFPSMLERFGGGVCLFSHRLAHFLVWQLALPFMNQALNELGLPAAPRFGALAREMRNPRVPLLYGFSPLVFPPPPDWPTWHRVTGYWFLSSQAQAPLPAEVEAFLQAGPSPVYLGFGSLVTPRLEETVRQVVDALLQMGERVVVLRALGQEMGWEEEERVLLVDEVPHLALFPRVRAVVHHGGAGTTAAALWAGVPQVILPAGADQPFWAERVFRLGVTPPPLPWRKVSVPGLLPRLRAALTNRALREKAAEVGERIRQEEGVRQAVQVLQAHFG